MSAYDLVSLKPRTDGASDAPLTERQMVPCLFASGVDVEIIEGVTNFVFWTQLPYLEGQTPERRIIARIAMPDGPTRQLEVDLRKRRTRGGN